MKQEWIHDLYNFLAKVSFSAMTLHFVSLESFCEVSCMLKLILFWAYGMIAIFITQNLYFWLFWIASFMFGQEAL
jgi:hypothetical protein